MVKALHTLDRYVPPALASLRGQPVIDRWHLAIRAEDNPQLAPGGTLDLTGLDDILVFFEYTFDYR